MGLFQTSPKHRQPKMFSRRSTVTKKKKLDSTPPPPFSVPLPHAENCLHYNKFQTLNSPSLSSFSLGRNTRQKKYLQRGDAAQNGAPTRRAATIFYTFPHTIKKPHRVPFEDAH